MMRRVLLVGSLLESGGISRFVKDLLSAKINYEICLFNTMRPPKPHTSKGAWGYRTLFAAGILRAMRNALVTGWHIFEFPFELLESRAVAVHIATSSHWSFWESSIYLMFSKLLGRKVIFHYLSDFHKFYNPAMPLEKALIQRVFKTADRVIVLSDSVRQIVASFMSERRVIVVPSSVKLSISCPAKRDWTADRTYVLFMGGNYGVRKGVKDLVAAIPRVLAEYSDVEFWLCGGGDVEVSCRDVEHGSRTVVKYLGLVDEATKLRLLSTANIYVLPSYNEGMPYGIIEAMAVGLPIIATKIGSIPEVVTDGENGLLISPGDIGALAKSILGLAKDHNMARKIANANREKALELFSLAKAFELIRRTYDSVLGVSS